VTAEALIKRHWVFALQTQMTQLVNCYGREDHRIGEFAPVERNNGLAIFYPEVADGPLPARLGGFFLLGRTIEQLYLTRAGSTIISPHKCVMSSSTWPGDIESFIFERNPAVGRTGAR
jgi:hypothetical protein